MSQMRSLRNSSLLKWLVCILLVYAISTIVVSFLSSSRPSTLSSSDGSAGTPSAWQQRCQYLELPVSGKEGPVPEKEYRLKGLAVVFRHGERSSLSHDDDPSGCTAFRDEDRRSFEDYRNLIEGEDFEYFLRADKPFKGFPRVPDRSRCVAGEMTAEGALQHVRLGKYMNERYGASRLFSADSHLNVSITSSQYHRTFQSAIAFSSSFFYKHKTSLPQIFVAASNFTFMCTSPSCACPAAVQWRRQYEKEHVQVFHSTAAAHIRDSSRALRALAAFQPCEDPFQLIDVSLGRYICRRRTLPCAGNGHCLSYDFLSELVNYTTARSSFMFAEQDSYIARRLQLVEANGVLHHLRDTLAKIRRFPHTNQIKIFSGHDVTLAPLLRVMGVPFTDPPHYVSRLVFEIYEKPPSSTLFIRLLYNGDDVTSRLPFCSNLIDNLCPAASFEQFIKYDILKMLGVNSIHELCKKV